ERFAIGRDRGLQGSQAVTARDLPPTQDTSVNRRAKGPLDRRATRTPLCRRQRVVQVANRRAPRAPRSALTSDRAARGGGACVPTWPARWMAVWAGPGC